MMNKKKRQLIKSFLIIISAFLISITMIFLGSGLESKYALKKDLSFNQVTSYGSVTKEVLESLRTPVHIYALFTPGQEDHQLIGLLERYQAAGNMLTYSIESLAKNPMLVHSISDSIDDSAVTGDCLIIYCKAKDRTRILTAKDYVSKSYDVQSGTFVLSGATYENSITQAIAYVSSDRLPTLHLLTGHGELTEEETGALRSFLSSRGYALKDVDLSRGNSLPNEGLLMVLSPRKDFTTSELQALMDFAGRGGSFFITTDYSDPSDMENFNLLLRAYGVSIEPGVVVAEENDKASYYDSPIFLMPYMQDSEITTPLMSAGQDRLMLAGARPLHILPELSGNVHTVSLLTSGKATVRPFDGKTLGEKPKGAAARAYDLAVYADRADEKGTHSRAFLCGNSSAFTVEWLFSNTYSTEFLTQIIQTIYPDHPTELAIQPKAAFRPGLNFRSPALPLSMILLVPIGVFVWGWVVLIKRRNL